MSDNEAREKALADRIENRPPLTLLELAADIASFGAGYDAAKAEPLIIDREALAAVLLAHGHVEWDEFDAGVMADTVIAHLSAQEAATEVGSRDAGLIQAEKVLRGIENHWPADSVAAAIHELRALRETVAESEEAATEVEATRAIELAMLEYSQAIRGDWSDFDGRSERDIIEGWVEELRNPNSEHTLEWWRNRLGICPDGNGHWAGFSWGHCREDDCPISYAQDQEGKTDE